MNRKTSYLVLGEPSYFSLVRDENKPQTTRVSTDRLSEMPLLPATCRSLVMDIGLHFPMPILPHWAPHL